MKSFKNEGMKGITLIALVLTIIVLLILAGVSIAMLAGDNGILTQANNSKKQTDIATIKEEVELSMLDYTIKNYINNVSLKEHFIEDLKLIEDKVTHNVKIIRDSAFNISNGVLKKVYYGGTEEEWEEIEIGVNNNALIKATKYWYSEQKPAQTGNYWHYVNGKIEEWQ